MNIFRLDDNPSLAARYHCDKHVVKMILETTQLLQTTHGATGWRNHPCAVWARESIYNYAWLYKLGVALCAEYSLRYGRIHACQQHFHAAFRVLPALPREPATNAPQCMPPQYKGPDAVRAYRAYYVGEKMGFAKWRHTETPKWVKEYEDGDKSKS